MPDETNTTPLIAVNATPTFDQISAALRSIGLVLGVLTAVAGFVSKRDLAGFIAFAQTSQFATAAAAIVAAVTFVWGQWHTRYRAKQLSAAGADPRNQGVVLKGSAP